MNILQALWLSTKPLLSSVNNTEVMISNMDPLQLSDGTPINVTVCASLPNVMALDSSLTVTVELEIGLSETGKMLPCTPTSLAPSRHYEYIRVQKAASLLRTHWNWMVPTHCTCPEYQRNQHLLYDHHPVCSWS